MASIIRTCPNSTTCPPDAPLDNFSSEADDTVDYISTRYAQVPPPLLHNFIATECGQTFVSQLSQLDADLQAAAAALQCVFNKFDPTPTLFTNAPQTCCVPCPDGTSTCYQVPGGIFPGLSQASADSVAHAAACDLVNRNKVCLGNIAGCSCVGSAYGAIITSSVPATVTLFAGSLPPGVTFSAGPNEGILLGTPTLLGQYTFQIKAQTAAGPYMIKTFTITVLQIITTNLPSFTIGTPYSFQLLAAGGSGNYAWKLTGGSLPTGITLSLSGLLSGTPTSPGVNPLQFTVIDTTCESIDQTFFPPSVALTTKSTTQIATVIGFPEYPGFVSTPPKKYRRLTWFGSAEQTLFNGTTQVAGARLDWSGSSEIDLQGNYTSLYSKNLSEMCTGADKLCMGISAPAGNPAPNLGSAGYNILGWIGQTPHNFCPLPGTPYSPVGDVGIKKGDQALTDRAVNQALGSGVIFVGADVFDGFVDTFQATSSTTGSDVSTGQQPNLLMAFQPLPCGTLVLFSDYLTTLGFQGTLKWNNNYSSLLDEEYTDAIALANAQVIQGNGAVAQNNPRTTGFVSQFTNVVFTLTASNLISGSSYTVSVDFADITAGTVTTKQYAVSGSAVTTTITDIIPTPPVGHLVQVRNPRITFS